MEYIQSFRAKLQHLVESPRAPFLWVLILCIFTLIFLAQIIGASYVYTTVRAGMDGQKTQQEKKIEQEVQLIYDANEYADVLKLTETRPQAFDEAIMRRTAKEEIDTTPEPTAPADTSIDALLQKKLPSAPDQKKVGL